MNISSGGGDGDAYRMWYGEENSHVNHSICMVNFSCPIRLSGSPSTRSTFEDLFFLFIDRCWLPICWQLIIRMRN